MGRRILHALLLCGSAPLAISGKSKTPLAGSQKCEKGIFESLAKDAVVPLCDAHYPNEKAKSEWAIVFYNKGTEGVQEAMNRVAIDMGNEPPEKSKSLKKAPIKQRKRIQNLAEKYEFEAQIPKKGLDEKGKEPLLKVGAVCCDCSSTTQSVCEKGLGVRVVKPGKDDKVMPDGEESLTNTENVVKFIMDSLGYVKGSAPATEEKKTETKASEDAPVGDVAAKIEELKAKKKQAAADEDFDLAMDLKKQIEKLEKELAKGGTGEDIKKKLEELQAQKKEAVANEDFKLASKLKAEIAKLEKKAEL